jgi:hypothetical protein
MKKLLFLYFLICGSVGNAQILSAIRNQTSAYQLGGFSLSGGTYKLLNMPLTTSTTDKAVTVNAAGNMRTNALSLQFVMNGGTTSTLGATFNGITVDKASPALGVLIDMTGTTSATSFREYKVRADNGGGYFSGGYFGTLFNMQRVTYGYLSVPDSSTSTPYANTLLRLYPFGQVVVGNTAPSLNGGKFQVAGTVTADTVKMRVRRSSAANDSILFWRPSDSSFTVASKITVPQGGTGLTALGSSLQQLRVNVGATALEYFTPSASVQTSGPIKDFNTDATGADSLYPYTVPASYLANNGDKVLFTYAGFFAPAGATARGVGIAVNGTTMAGLANGVTLGGKWKIQGTIIRVSNSVIRYVADISFDNSGVGTNLTLLTNDEITGQNLSANGARIALTVVSPNTNVTAILGSLTYISAAP